MSRRNSRPRENVWVDKELERIAFSDRHQWIDDMAEEAQRASNRRRKRRQLRRKRAFEDHVDY